MAKKVFSLVPDYTLPCLNFLRSGILPDNSEIDLLLPYNINSFFVIFLSWFSNKFKERRINFLSIKKHTSQSIKIHYPPLIIICYYLIKSSILEKKEFKYYNTLRWILENKTLSRFDKFDYDIIYGFDTASKKIFDYFEETTKYLESRGCFIDFVLMKNKEINNIHGTKLNSSYDSSDLWFEKMRDEVKSADVIIGYSDFHLKQFNMANPKASKIKYIIPSKFDKSRKIIKASIQINFCFIGTLAIEKGIILLINSWKKLQLDFRPTANQHTLTIIGSCNDSTIIKLLEGVQNINYLGKLNSKELSEFLDTQVHVLLNPTYYDSFGMVIMEAVSKNIPIISSSRCGAIELLNHRQVTKIDDISNEEQWVTEILKYMMRPDLIEKKSKELSKIFF